MNRPEFIAFIIKDKKQLIEAGKSALIVLLVITSIMLLGEAGLFSGLPGSFAISDVFSLNDATSDSESTGVAAASPFYIVVTPDEGSHCAVMYDGEKIDEAYGRFSASLGMALGSSGIPKEVSEEEWEAALSGCGVYFDFLSDQPLSVLAGWLGTSVSGGAANHTARRICLAADDSGVALYYIRAREGTAYRCDTALSYSAISANIEQYLPDGATFNFELESPLSFVDSYAIILAKQSKVNSITAQNPLSGGVDDDALLSALGMNSFLASRYTETDGTEVFVEGDAALRVDTDGTVIFSGAKASADSEPLTAAQTIEIARVLCEKILGRYSRDASLYLSYIGYDTASEVYTIRFDYMLNGLSVSFSDGESAAELTLDGSEVTSARLIFREYTNEGTTEKPLPSLQAASIVQVSGGGEPVLSYTDDLKSVAVGWIIR